METGTKLGKIESIRFGFGGYQDVMFGLTTNISGKGWSTSDFTGFWKSSMERGETAKWTEDDRDRAHLDAARLVERLLEQAGKSDISELTGTPVEVEFKNGVLDDWRVLEEVL